MYRDRRLHGPFFGTGTMLVAVNHHILGALGNEVFRHKGPKGSSEATAIFEEREEEELYYRYHNDRMMIR